MLYLIYIGKNRKYIKDFSELSQRNVYYSANDIHKAIPSINRIENKEDIIVFYEREYNEKDLSNINEIRKKYPLIYIVLVTETSLGNDAPRYLKAGINNTLSPNTTQQEIDEIFLFHDKRRKEHSLNTEKSNQIKVFKLPLWKRSFDIVFSTIALIILSPILFITALAIFVESRGPILHISKRVGTNYLIIDFLRFRSRYTRVGKDPEGFTKVGRFIRKYNIHDLPQFINILKGDMSVVGNRPLPLNEAEQLTSDDNIDRFMAPAGLTGLWQVQKKGDPERISAEERKLLDIKYAKIFSFSLDMKIILKTFTEIVRQKKK